MTPLTRIFTKSIKAKCLTTILIIATTLTTAKSKSLRDKNSENSDDIWAGKRRIATILEKAGIQVSSDTARQLPYWDDIVQLYGPSPIISGLETCPTFQIRNGYRDTMITIGGQFNTGTSYLNKLLTRNCQNVADVRSDVWWKHSPVEWSHRTEYGVYRADQNPEYKVAPYKPSHTEISEGHMRVSYDRYYQNLLPVVNVKDPFFWMSSMCRRPYAVKWVYSERYCPNLAPYENDAEVWTAETDGGVDVFAKVPRTFNHPDLESFHLRYASLVDYWNRFNGGHLESPFPHLVVRYEDLLFHTEEVVDAVCRCAGGQVKEEFEYILKETPVGGDWAKANNFVEAMIKYGKRDNRLSRFTEADLDYSRRWLNFTLMDHFHYMGID